MRNLRNTCQFIGRLGADPQVKTLTNGNKVTNLSIAVDDSYKDKSGTKIERSYWINLVAWGKVGELIAEYMCKGEEHMFQGKLTNRSYETQDGQKRWITEVVVDEINLLRNDKSAQTTTQAPVSAVHGDETDDLLF